VLGQSLIRSAQSQLSKSDHLQWLSRVELKASSLSELGGSVLKVLQLAKNAYINAKQDEFDHFQLTQAMKEQLTRIEQKIDQLLEANMKAAYEFLELAVIAFRCRNMEDAKEKATQAVHSIARGYGQINDALGKVECIKLTLAAEFLLRVIDPSPRHCSHFIQVACAQLRKPHSEKHICSAVASELSHSLMSRWNKEERQRMLRELLRLDHWAQQAIHQCHLISLQASQSYPEAAASTALSNAASASAAPSSTGCPVWCHFQTLLLTSPTMPPGVCASVAIS
jgi:hypothetical protein